MEQKMHLFQKDVKANVFVLFEFNIMYRKPSQVHLHENENEKNDVVER